MRRRIRLTGRRELPRSSVTVRFLDLNGRRVLALDIADRERFRDFPADARVSLRLQEHKRTKVVSFGTVGAPKPIAELDGFICDAPTCELRITATEKIKRSMLLGSTTGWTIRGEDDDAAEGRRSILLFQPADIAPRLWKLEIREADLPIVSVDKRIPGARSWAQSDPVFIAGVMPAIIRELFSDILSLSRPADIDWVAKWLEWSELLLPGRRSGLASEIDRNDYINDLIEEFCARHDISDLVLESLGGEQ